MSAFQMEQEIKDAIAKNLPSQIGNVLAERLAMIPDLERQLDEANLNVTSTSNGNASLRAQLDIATADIAAHVALDAREKIISGREMSADLNAAKKELEYEKKISTASIAMMTIVFKNPVYQESHFGSVQNPNTNCSMPTNNNVTKSIQI